MGGKEVRSLLQLSERWPCHIWLVGRIKFASLEVNVSLGLLVNPILLVWEEPQLDWNIVDLEVKL